VLDVGTGEELEDVGAAGDVGFFVGGGLGWGVG
jgi:hypothetical protein